MRKNHGSAPWLWISAAAMAVALVLALVGNGTVRAQQSGAGLSFIPVTPCRVVDTRGTAGPFGGPSLAGDSSRSFVVPQSGCGIPPTAQAYSLNVTVVPAG